MKKILKVIAGLILVGIALSFIKPIISIGIGIAIAYFCFKKFKKSSSELGKLGWGIAGIAGFLTFFGSKLGHVGHHGHMHHGMLSMIIPALMGVAVVALLCYGYKKLKTKKSHTSSNEPEYDDFKNFEKEWKDMMNKHR